MIDLSWRRPLLFALPALPALLLTSCGYIGQPMVPLANVPNRIIDLAAVQRGSQIIVHFTVPTLTTENNPIDSLTKEDLRVGTAPDPFNPTEWAAQATPVSAFENKDGVATYRFPASAFTGKSVAIAARSISGKGKASEWSNFEFLHVLPPPEPPSQVQAENTAQGVRVTWTGPGEQFRVLRRVGTDKEYSVAATVPAHDWTDAPIDYGKPYSYVVQAIVSAGDKKIAESDLSPASSLTPVDVFPPAVPSGVRADRLPNGISLVWDPDSDADLAGYRIYRAIGQGPWQMIAEVNAVPAYSDTTVEHGKTYRYAVTAFDKAAKPNESERSAPVEIDFP